jgi:hypothetical protein
MHVSNLNLNELLGIIKSYYKLAVKHSLISILSAGSEFLFFLLFFSYLKINLFISYFLSFMIAFLVGITGHTYFTFSLRIISKRSFYLFIIQCSIAFILGYFIIQTFLDLHFTALLSKSIQLAIVFFFNLIFGKNFTFKKY